jgi:hypothetical protein
MELGDQAGAQLSAQVLSRNDGGEGAISQKANKVEVRSGQTLRLLVRPQDGTARPSEPECPVRVSIGRILAVARLLTPGRLAIDRDNAYGLLRPGEERAVDFEIKPLEEWDTAFDQIEMDNLVISLPQTAELIARLPAPFRPPPGTVCADVFYPDSQPAAAVTVNLSALPGRRPTSRQAGPDGRVCWDGFDEMLFGELSLDPKVDPALGQPRSRYVSHEASYRLFIVKRRV